MYKSIDKILKVLGYVFFGLGCLISVIAMIGYIYMNHIGEGIICLIGGLFGSFLIGALIYGFGVLIEHTSSVDSNVKMIRENKVGEVVEEDDDEEKESYCDHCGKEVRPGAEYCPSCGAKLK